MSEPCDKEFDTSEGNEGDGDVARPDVVIGEGDDEPEGAVEEDDNGDALSEGSDLGDSGDEADQASDELWAMVARAAIEVRDTSDLVAPFPGVAVPEPSLVIPTRPANAGKHWDAWVAQRLPLDEAPCECTTSQGVSVVAKELLKNKLMFRSWEEGRLKVEPLDLWELFFTPAMLDLAVAETNNYARFKQCSPRPEGLHERYSWPPLFLKSWKNVTHHEMKIYLGLCYCYGMTKCPGIHRFFSHQVTATRRRAPACDMISRDRFKAIRSCLHVRNELQPLAPGELRKIGPFLNAFEEACREMYGPGTYLALDEMMIRFEGNFAFVHRKQHKPTSEGMKMYAIADSATGYTICFELDRRDGKTTIADFVKKLCERLSGK